MEQQSSLHTQHSFIYLPNSHSEASTSYSPFHLPSLYEDVFTENETLGPESSYVQRSVIHNGPMPTRTVGEEEKEEGAHCWSL